MTALSVLLASLAVILVPLAVMASRARHSRQAKIARAWQDALERQHSKSAELDRIALRLERSLAAERKLLDTVAELKEKIAELGGKTPDQDALRLIETRTEAALAQIGDVLDSQIDPEGQPRLTELFDALAARHANDSKALVRLMDVMAEPEEQRAVAAKGADIIAAAKPAADEDDEPVLISLPQGPAAAAVAEQPRIH